MSEEENKNSSNSQEITNSSQNSSTEDSNANFVTPGNLLSEMYTNYNSALRGAKGLPPDWGYNVKAVSRMAELTSKNLKGFGLASLDSTSNAYKNIVSMRLPDTKSHILAAKILSGFPNHNDKVAERLKKICEPSFKTGQILSKLAGKSDWANNAVGKTFLKYGTANINDSFNNSAIADIIKRNNKLNKQLFASPVAGYYRDLLKRGNILSDFNKSLDLCQESLAYKKESDFKSCVEKLRKIKDKISLPQYKIPETQIKNIDARLDVLSSIPLVDTPPRQTVTMVLQSVVETFVPALYQIMEPSHNVLLALNKEVSERLSSTEEVLRSQLEITEKLLSASQLTQQNVEALVTETQTNNNEIKELLDISKENAETVKQQLATAEKNGNTVKELLNASQLTQKNIEALVSETKTNNNEIKKLLEVSKENTETVKQQLVTAKQNSKSSNRWAWASCILSIVAISIAVWSECSDKTEELIDIVKKSHPWSEQQISSEDAKNVHVAFQTVTGALQKNVQLKKDNIQFRQKTDRLQKDLKNAQNTLAELEKKYKADKVAWTQEKQKLYAEITVLKKQIEELNAKLISLQTKATKISATKPEGK